MTHTHSLPADRVDITIQQGIEWYWAEATYYLAPASTMPDLSTWTATFTVYPHGDTTLTPVISLATGSGITLGVSGADKIETELDAAANAGESLIILDDGTGVTVGRHICIELDDGSIFVTTVTDASDPTAPGLQLPLPRDAALGADVTHFADTHMVSNILVHLSHTATSLLTPWGQGLYNLDLIDDFGRPFVRYAGLCCLEEGRPHG